MNKYEGMFIFPDDFNEERLDEAVDKVKAEIEKAGGTVDAATKLGRRPFARALHKKNGGIYYVVTFDMTGEQLAGLRSRLKFSEEIFRAEFYRADKPVAAPAEAEPAEA